MGLRLGQQVGMQPLRRVEDLQTNDAPVLPVHDHKGVLALGWVNRNTVASGIKGVSVK